MKKTFCDICGGNISYGNAVSFYLPYPFTQVDIDDDLHAYDCGTSFKNIPLDMCVSCLKKIWNGQNEKPIDVKAIFLRTSNELEE